VATGSTSTRDDRKKFEKAQKSPLEAAGEYLDPGIQESSPSDGLGGPVGPHLTHSAVVNTRENARKHTKRAENGAEPRARFFTTF
jgi:hypothetical protein